MSETIVTVAATGLDAKRAEAKAYLGANWVRHPEYVPSPRHSNNQETYSLARQPYLHAVASQAALVRQANPDFQRAEKLRQQIGQ